MQLSRRETLAMGLGATALALLPIRALAAGEDLVAAFTGGADVGDGGITLTAPEIAENGNTVPVSVDAPGAAAIMLIATGNPNPSAKDGISAARAPFIRAARPLSDRSVAS